MLHMETVQNIWIIVIIILLTAITYALIDLKSHWDRFSLQDWKELYNFCIWEKSHLDFLYR